MILSQILPNLPDFFVIIYTNDFSSVQNSSPLLFLAFIALHFCFVFCLVFVLTPQLDNNSPEVGVNDLLLWVSP